MAQSQTNYLEPVPRAIAHPNHAIPWVGSTSCVFHVQPLKLLPLPFPSDSSLFHRSIPRFLVGYFLFLGRFALKLAAPACPDLADGGFNRVRHRIRISRGAQLSNF